MDPTQRNHQFILCIRKIISTSDRTITARQVRREMERRLNFVKDSLDDHKKLINDLIKSEVYRLENALEALEDQNPIFNKVLNIKSIPKSLKSISDEKNTVKKIKTDKERKRKLSINMVKVKNKKTRYSSDTAVEDLDPTNIIQTRTKRFCQRGYRKQKDGEKESDHKKSKIEDNKHESEEEEEEEEEEEDDDDEEEEEEDDDDEFEEDGEEEEEVEEEEEEEVDDDDESDLEEEEDENSEEIDEKKVNSKIRKSKIIE